MYGFIWIDLQLPGPSTRIFPETTFLQLPIDLNETQYHSNLKKIQILAVFAAKNVSFEIFRECKMEFEEVSRYYRKELPCWHSNGNLSLILKSWHLGFLFFFSFCFVFFFFVFLFFFLLSRFLKNGSNNCHQMFRFHL